MQVTYLCHSNFGVFWQPSCTIELSGSLNFKRDFEILGIYKKASNDNEPVYERVQNGLSNGGEIYLYHRYGKWIIAPYGEYDKQSGLGWLWKVSSGLNNENKPYVEENVDVF